MALAIALDLDFHAIRLVTEVTRSLPYLDRARGRWMRRWCPGTTREGGRVTNDMDQSLEFIAGFVALMFLVPFLMTWLDDGMSAGSSRTGNRLESLRRRLLTRRIQSDD